MRVLITNGTLQGRGGSESFVRDLARGLQARGHSVMAFTSDLSQRPRLLDYDQVPVVTDLERLPVRPDVIHAQHHLDAMVAIAMVPGVPAIYHSHGATWKGCPPLHPRIHEYVVITPTAAERMAVESGIPLSSITLLPNGIDLQRFFTVRQPAAVLRRALFYNRYHQPQSPTVAAVRTATERLGISLDFVGQPFGTTTSSPESLLPTYDLVFAAGMSAIEALACGCAVVLLGRGGCGELVRPGKLARDQEANFTIAANIPPPSPEHIEATLVGYRSEDADAVTRAVREHADFSRVVATLLDVYERALTRHRAATPDPQGEALAMARYLQTIVPLVKMTDRVLGGEWSSSSRISSFEELRAELGALQRRVDAFAQDRL